MTIAFQCVHCQKPLQVNDTLAGKKVKCPGCQTVLTVPAPVGAATGGGGASAAAAPAKPANGTGSSAAVPARDLAAANNTTNGAKPASGAPKPVAAVKPAALPAAAKPPANATSPPPAAPKPVAGTPPGPTAKPPVPAVPKPPAPAAKALPPAPGVTPAATNAPSKPALPKAPAPVAAKPAAKAPEPPKPLAKPASTPAAASPPTPKPVAPKLPDALKATMKGAKPPEAPGAAAKTGDSAPVPKLPTTPGKTSDSAPGTTRVPDAVKATLRPTPPKAGEVKKAAPFKPPPRKPANGDGKPPVDADELAASLLFEDEKKPEVEDPVAAGKPIKTECFYCGEAGEYPAELAGKQAPCLSCRKIIKIPLPVSDKPKDWREVERRPSGAKRDIQELDDAWGTDIRANVGQDTLEATGAVEIKRPKEPLAKRIKRWTYITLSIALLAGLGWHGWKVRNISKQEGAIKTALAYVEKDRKGPKLITNEAAAEIYRCAGEFSIREDKPDDAVPFLKEAHGSLLGARAGLERDLGFLELALTITDLSGTPEQVLDRKRRKWQDVREQAKPTLAKITYPEVRADAARRITRRLITRGTTPAERAALALEAEALVLLMPVAPEDRPELLARLGMELFLAGETASAEAVATKALGLYKAPSPPPVSPTLIALLIVLGKQKEANELAPPPANNQGLIPAEARVGYALAMALGDDKWDDARKLAADINGEPVDRVQAYLALAELALAKNKPEEAAALITEAAKSIGAPRVTPWMRFVLVRTGARAGKAAEMRELAKTAFAAKDQVALLNRAQVEILRGELALKPGQSAMPEMQAEAEKKEHAFPPALTLLARHNARYGSGDGTRGDVERWEPESFRAIGLVGVALGMQDRAADAPAEPVAKK
jgi:phage FluMu protein Com